MLSGGYPDDEDHGEYVIYTGHGGKDPNSSRQIEDQSINAFGNAGLITSRVEGLPVRVTRGSGLKSQYAPDSGYRFDGLYIVASNWIEAGRDGFQIVRFRLERLADQEALIPVLEAAIEPVFASTTVSRRIRDSQLARQIKSLYNDHCQVCDQVIPGIDGRTYSEGAHVRPLGRPHLGGDALENLLCLCPNHHTQLDIGGMVILDDMSVVDTLTQAQFANIRFAATHRLAPENAEYHRRMWAPLGSRALI